MYQLPWVVLILLLSFIQLKSVCNIAVVALNSENEEHKLSVQIKHFLKISIHIDFSLFLNNNI